MVNLPLEDIGYQRTLSARIHMFVAHGLGHVDNLFLDLLRLLVTVGGLAVDGICIGHWNERPAGVQRRGQADIRKGIERITAALL